METEYDPQEVARIVSQALQDQTILPLSFIETTLYDRLFSLLTRYMPQPDVIWVISELRNEFASGFTKMNPAQLHSIIRHCVKCESVERPPVLPLWNTTDPDLMLIAENPSSVKQYLPDFVAALKAAGFSSQRCMLTYVTRCSIQKPDATVIKNCLPYLHTELAVVNPKLVMTLGLSVYTALTGDAVSKLVEIKGSTFWFGPYAVMPEQSLGSIAFSQEKSQSAQYPLSTSLQTAYAFLYGGKKDE